jgi:hypothetical protein
MKIEISKLISFSEYAKKNSKTTQWTYHMAKTGKIKVLKISGINFVLLD